MWRTALQWGGVGVCRPAGAAAAAVGGLSLHMQHATNTTSFGDMQHYALLALARHGGMDHAAGAAVGCFVTVTIT